MHMSTSKQSAGGVSVIEHVCCSCSTVEPFSN